MTNGLPPLPEIPAEQRTPLVEALLAVIGAQQDRIAKLEETVQILRDEIAVLKGQKPRPKIAPSRLEQPPPPPIPADGQKRPGSEKKPKNAQLTITQERIIPFPNPPSGSISKGHEEYLVQELVLRAEVTRYLRERIVTSDGQSLLAPLPADVLSGQHFGPTLISYILYQYHHNHVTQPLLQDELAQRGIVISAGQINRFLTEDKQIFHAEKAELLTAGLATAQYIQVDDTGARHEGKNGYCTQIGNAFFAYFESTDSKSRLNFLQVLRGEHRDYVSNEITLRVLGRPETPLHNNASESDIRDYVKKRKISGSTRSADGRRCRDTFASLKKTCRKLGIRFWDYLQDRVRGVGQVARLADLIRHRAAEAIAAKAQAVPP